jgi:Periplasmic protein TonB, links inner and outer membranes
MMLLNKLLSNPGGEKALLNFFQENIKYPAAALKDDVHVRVIVKFVVRSGGKVVSPVILKGVSPALDA